MQGICKACKTNRGLKKKESETEQKGQWNEMCKEAALSSWNNVTEDMMFTAGFMQLKQYLKWVAVIRSTVQVICNKTIVKNAKPYFTGLLHI